MTRLCGVVIGVFLVMCFGFVLVGLPYLGVRNEKWYQRDTPAEVKAAHLAMAEQLKTVTPGDFIFLPPYEGTGERIHSVLKNPEKRPFILHVVFSSRVTYEDSLEYLGRHVTRFVRKTDADWPEVAKQFFAQ